MAPRLERFDGREGLFREMYEGFTYDDWRNVHGISMSLKQVLLLIRTTLLAQRLQGGREDHRCTDIEGHGVHQLHSFLCVGRTAVQAR